MLAKHGSRSHLRSKEDQGRPYGWFHILFWILTATSTTLLCVFCRDNKEKTVRIVALVAWITMVALEIYKQFVFAYSVKDNQIVGDYAWYAFPYQLCSTPMYVLPFVAFLKEGKVRDCFVSYVSTFALFGGLVVYLYPNDVFIKTIGINIQTMIRHGLQLVTGIFFAVRNRKQLNSRYFLRSVPVFVGALVIAIILNEAVYACLVAKGMNDTFNMFYISRHFDCTLPILSSIYTAVPYPVFLLVYIFGFVLAAAIVFYIIFGIVKLVYYILGKYDHATQE